MYDLTFVLPEIIEAKSTVEKATLSSKGQVILPKSVRQAHDWSPGTEFSVEDVDDGVLLRPLKPFQPAKLEEVFACLQYAGRPKTIDEMDDAIAAEIQERHARGRD